MSSNESFLLMMRAAGAKLLGGRSFGSSGNPLPHRLSNGVVVNLPSWREYQSNGTPLEGNGILPDRTVAWPGVPTDDVVLRASLSELQQQR
jgi:C-terminal processing protease CtpA/Prc